MRAGGLLFLTLLAVSGCKADPNAPKPTTQQAQQSPSENVSLVSTTNSEDSKAPLPRLNRDDLSAERTLTAVHMANGSGELEDCGCNINPLGGLARRAKWLADNSERLGEKIILDAGDLFTDGNPLDLPGGSDHDMVLARGELIIDTYNEMHYKAFTLGDRDLLLGLEALKRLEAKATFPFLGANITKTDGQRPFKASHVIETPTGNIGVIGVVSATSPSQGKLDQGGQFIVTDPFEAVKTEATRLKNTTDVIWVLGHIRSGEGEIIIEEIPEVTLVLGGQEMTGGDQLAWVGGAATIQGGEKGKKLGVTTMVIRAPGTSFYDPSRKERLRSKASQLRTKVDARTQALKSAMAKDEGGGQNIEWLKKNLVKMRTELQVVEMDMEDLDTGGEKDKNPMVFDRIEMQSSLPQDAEIAAKITALKQRFPKLEKQGESK